MIMNARYNWKTMKIEVINTVKIDRKTVSRKDLEKMAKQGNHEEVEEYLKNSKITECVNIGYGTTGYDCMILTYEEMAERECEKIVVTGVRFTKDRPESLEGLRPSDLEAPGTILDSYPVEMLIFNTEDEDDRDCFRRVVIVATKKDDPVINADAPNAVLIATEKTIEKLGRM